MNRIYTKIKQIFM